MRVRFIAEGIEGVGRLLDVSRAGLLVGSFDPPREGALIVLQFEHPERSLLDLRGEVRWAKRSRGGGDGTHASFGVLLREPSLEFRDFFLWAMERHAKTDEGRTDLCYPSPNDD